MCVCVRACVCVFCVHGVHVCGLHNVNLIVHVCSCVCIIIEMCVQQYVHSKYTCGSLTACYINIQSMHVQLADLYNCIYFDV